METWSKKSASPYPKSGSILFISLWSLVILLIFAVAIGGRVAQEIVFARYLKERMISLHLTKGCVNRVLLELEKDKTPEYDTLYELSNERSVKLEDGSFKFNIGDEASLINVNTASQSTLERLPGVTPDLAKSIFESTLKPFLLKEELLLVDNVTPEIFSGIRELTTTYTDGKVNINTASIEVLKILGLEDSLVEIILAYRKGEDQLEATQDDRVFKSVATILSDLREFTILTTAQELQFTELLSSNALCVNAKNLKLNIETLVLDKPLRNYHVILDRATAKIRSWQEQ